jgi:hypothetical protein
LSTQVCLEHTRLRNWAYGENPSKIDHHGPHGVIVTLSLKNLAGWPLIWG